MKFKQGLHKISKNCSAFLAVLFLLYFTSCATKHVQFGKNLKDNPIQKIEGNKIQTFYLVGDAGNLNLPENKNNLEILKSDLQKADSASYLLFLGDNVYPKGLNPDKKSKENLEGKEKLDIQIDLGKNFKGKTLFIPGNHDWYSNLDGLIAQEKYIKKNLNQKKVFLPKDGCGIDKVKINDNLGLIVVDSQWFLEDWDKHPGINEKCDIKTREAFFAEFESQLNKFQNQTAIVVVHHPLVSNGAHGGQYSIRQQLFPFGNNIPLPGIGSFINVIRTTSGLSTQDLQNPIYRNFATRISTLLKGHDNVVVVSGHDHNLQFIQEDNLKQIISGSASKDQAAKVTGKNDFSYGDKGYAVLDVYDNGAVQVSYYAFEKNNSKLLMSNKVIKENVIEEIPEYGDIMENTVLASVYNPEVTDKSNIYKFFLGKHYRDIYGKKVPIEVGDLTSIYGGLTPLKKGGGHQTNSLRLMDKENREYNMRAVKKSATRFIQSVAFKNSYVVDDFEDTMTEKFLLDFYTTTNPYYPLTISPMQKALGIYHAQPKLYYIPKQKSLEKFNKEFGDELYMIEERPVVEHQDIELFGSPNDIIGTEEMLANIQNNKKTFVDKDAYMKARLFDMLIGDWDRHSDQWRWAEFHDDGNIIYKPIPRDRDQVFPRFDGALFKAIMKIPALKHMEDYKDDITSVKWFNREPYPLDLAILEASDLEAWKKQAEFIQENLTEEIVRNAFELLPEEVKDDHDNKVIETLLNRKDKLQKFAEEYHKVLSRVVILKGSNENDEFIITRLPKGETRVEIYSGPDKKLVFDRVFDKKLTKEIRIYGLNNSDNFIVKGKPSNPIKIRLIGGVDDDVYAIENQRKIKIYDFKDGNLIANDSFFKQKTLVNDYDINNYDYTLPTYNVFTMLPNIGYNPDDGFMFGLSPTYTVNGFNGDPFTSRHRLKMNYFFATEGFEIAYKGTFLNFIRNWNLDVNAKYTSPTFSTNFFGFGNETENLQKELGMNYNRVRKRSYEIGPSFYKVFRNTGRLDLFANYKFVKIEENKNRIVTHTPEVNEEVFRGQNFTEIGANYLYKNFDNESLPTLGMYFLANAKWTGNNDKIENNFIKTEANLGIIHKITSNGKLTFSTLLKGKFLIGDGYEFYQAVSLGGDKDLRGLRDDRFTGDKVFLQSSDLRLDLFKISAGVPMKMGIFTGFDYGRIWYKNEGHNKWHSSYGGGIWLNGAQIITAQISYFKGGDVGRFVFGLNFGM